MKWQNNLEELIDPWTASENVASDLDSSVIDCWFMPI